jgi:hypothetical protein
VIILEQDPPASLQLIKNYSKPLIIVAVHLCQKKRHLALPKPTEFPEETAKL